MSAADFAAGDYVAHRGKGRQIGRDAPATTPGAALGMGGMVWVVWTPLTGSWCSSVNLRHVSGLERLARLAREDAP